MEPFVPLSVSTYNEKEFESCYLYYLDRNWLQHPHSKLEKLCLQCDVLSRYLGHNEIDALGTGMFAALVFTPSKDRKLVQCQNEMMYMPDVLSTR